MRTKLEKQIAKVLGAETDQLGTGTDCARSIHEVKREIYRKVQNRLGLSQNENFEEQKRRIVCSEEMEGRKLQGNNKAAEDMLRNNHHGNIEKEI